MRILHINSYYTGTNFYKQLYDFQQNAGLDIHVFVPTYSHVENKRIYGSYATVSKNHFKIDRYFFHLKLKKIYLDLLKKINIPDSSLLHAHSLFVNGAVAMKVKEHFNIPYVVTVRNTDVNLFFKRLIHLRKTGLKILENADHIIFISDAYKEEVLRKYVPPEKQRRMMEKISIIANGIDDFWFKENLGKNLIKPNPDPKQRNMRLLHVGDINKNKNISTTVQAIELLREKDFNITFDVVGAIEDQKIFSRIAQLPYVNYLGFKDKTDLLRIYRENDILVLPSIYETFGLVYAEAMSQGLPVIYTKAQGFDGQFKDGIIGYSVDCHSPKDIAESILRIYEDYSAISEACIIHSAKYRWSGISESISNIYKLCINEFHDRSC